MAALFLSPCSTSDYRLNERKGSSYCLLFTVLESVLWKTRPFHLKSCINFILKTSTVSSVCCRKYINQFTQNTLTTCSIQSLKTSIKATGQKCTFEDVYTGWTNGLQAWDASVPPLIVTEVFKALDTTKTLYKRILTTQKLDLPAVSRSLIWITLQSKTLNKHQ